MSKQGSRVDAIVKVRWKHRRNLPSRKPEQNAWASRAEKTTTLKTTRDENKNPLWGFLFYFQNNIKKYFYFYFYKQRGSHEYFHEDKHVEANPLF